MEKKTFQKSGITFEVEIHNEDTLFVKIISGATFSSGKDVEEARYDVKNQRIILRRAYIVVSGKKYDGVTYFLPIKPFRLTDDGKAKQKKMLSIAMQGVDMLSHEEERFINSISGSQDLSEKQYQWLDAICEKVCRAKNVLFSDYK